MKYLSRRQTVATWVLQLGVAAILLQTLFFKFTGAEESVYIFSTVGRFANIPGVEPWGRIGSGVMELAASLLLLVPATAAIGAILTMGVMAGAIMSHLVILGRGWRTVVRLGHDRVHRERHRGCHPPR
jgi:hypothetical protein